MGTYDVCLKGHEDEDDAWMSIQATDMGYAMSRFVLELDTSLEVRYFVANDLLPYQHRN